MAFELELLLDNLRDSRFGFDYLDEGEQRSNVELLRTYWRQMDACVQAGALPDVLERPLGCQLEVTYRCNARCIHCYNDSASVRNEARAELTQPQWLDVARQVGELGVFQVVISGGEPLVIRERVFEIMDILKEYGVVFLFITNGTLVTPEVIEKMVTGGYRFCWVQVSIDGHTAGIHDMLRGQSGSWEKATRAVRMLSEAGLPTVIAHTVFRINLDHFQEMAELALSLGAIELITGPCMPSGRAALDPAVQALLLDAEGRERFVDAVLRARMSEKIAGRRIAGGRTFKIRPAAGVAMSLRVRAIDPSQVMLIRPDGEVKVDCVLPFSVGNVRETDLESIWRQTASTIWRRPEVLEYISQIQREEDVLKEYLPRPHIDASLRLK